MAPVNRIVLSAGSLGEHARNAKGSRRLQGAETERESMGARRSVGPHFVFVAIGGRCSPSTGDGSSRKRRFYFLL